MISFGPDICHDFDRAATKEWLETNGLGGYASSTIIGANTRRYHGLLVAALTPPTGRTVLLAKLEETVAFRDAEYDLSCNQYPGRIHPEGHRHLRQFLLDPFPTFHYEIPTGVPARLEKTVAMCHGRDAVIVRYRVIACPGNISLIVRPIVNCRDAHHLMKENPAFDTSVEITGGRDVIVVKPYPHAPPLYIHFPGTYFELWEDWYHNFEYREEEARGLDWREDQWSPGFFTCLLAPAETRYLIATTEPPDRLDPARLLEAERGRRSSLIRDWELAPEPIKRLVSSADAFIVTRPGPKPEASPPRERRAGSYSILAGYHWFEEWGRDAMIALPGLTLVTGRYEVARSVLETLAGYCSEGMIPNRIPDANSSPDYNTADATLWMFWAAHKYLDYTADEAFVRESLLPVFLDVVAWHVKGTRHNIKVDGDGLLRAGGPATQLTWMDAKVGDWVVTPRWGKPVEVNALWHHALRFVEEMGADHEGPSADEVGRQFAAKFWNEDAGYLNDVVDGETPFDSALRPNQIIAVSLPYPILDMARARRVVAAVQQDLLTPYGLRTLSPRHPRYCSRYAGDQRARDGAYHQGTVWPWLLGQFITAYLRVAEDGDAARQEARGCLSPIWDHLRDAGLNSISEIFDGDPPHNPRGCIAQAWSVAEVLRAAVEDLQMACPPPAGAPGPPVRNR